MARHDGFSEKKPTEVFKSPTLTREMLFLAEQAAEGKIKVLPGETWALHYPVSADIRSEKLQGLLDGVYSAEEVAGFIKPDALFYDVGDIPKHGLEKVSARVRDLSAFISHFDYPKFASFVEGMHGHDISLNNLDLFYGDITKARIQKKVFDSYGQTGQKQIEQALKSEATKMIEDIVTAPRAEKVLKALKIKWLHEDMGIVTMESYNHAVSTLSGDERQLFESLQSAYRDYVQQGDEVGYEKLVDSIRNGLAKIDKPIENDESSESMQELEKDLEPFKDQMGTPGSSEDSAIPPDDSDEYHTPPPVGKTESKEQKRERSIFTIEPPLEGWYASGKKSYFDVDSKTWSKKKQLVKYSASPSGSGRWKISGVLEGDLKSIPLPNGYALDAASLQVTGGSVEVFRDQNGCFYLKISGRVRFSIDFLKESSRFQSQPIAEDTTPLYRGQLSVKTETAISRLMGTPTQKAEQVRQYVWANHFYPGGGDLDAAQALQYKLRSQSTGDNYLQNLDNSEYLECYSANTKFIAMMRQAGVPARLVIGHKVDGASDGKSVMTQNTGHAWSEIWDGQAWRRFDATPKPKPEDKKPPQKDEDKTKKDPAEQAEDGGIDQSPPSDKSEPGEQDDKNQGKPSSTDSGNPLEQMNSATDEAVEKAESQLDQAKEAMEKVQKQKEKLEEKLDQADKFKDLADLQKELEQSELFDDLKEDLQEKIDAKQEQMKDEIKAELDKMVEDGFMDETKREEILKELEEKKLEELDRVQKRIDQENSLYNAYEDIRGEVMPLVDKWFQYFVERLPKQPEVGIDEDSLTRRGALNRRAVMKPRNLIFGTVRNPMEIRPSVKPRFLASILVDVSGSMAGEKLISARKLLVFYSELFSRISQQFGYIMFSINIFSDSLTKIKGFDQDYESARRYDFDDGAESTVKLRMMQQLSTQGGTNMLEAIQKASDELNKQVEDYPEFASAFYFVGDGGDTCGNGQNIKQFLQVNDSQGGFGEHMYSAILLGNEQQRVELAVIFGDDHTKVAPNFEDLIEKSMNSLDDDLEDYFKGKVS